MSGLKLVLIAIGLEATGFAAVFARGDAFLLLGAYFVAHGCASLLVAVVMMRFVPHLFPNSERAGFVYFAALAFFVPVLGIVGQLLLLFFARFAPTGPRQASFLGVEAPRFAGAPTEAKPGFNRAGIRPVLQSPSAPAGLKLKALLALQAIPSRAANNLIREMLREPGDDMRLLAYGLLDAREKVLDARIHAGKTRLEAAGTAAARIPLLKELAELYWELVYRGIVQGDLLRHAVSEAQCYLGEFLEHEPRDAGAWALHARLLVLDRRYADADAAFGRALGLGLPESRALPYVAELAFHARDFRRVRSLMREVGRHPAAALAAVARYWSDSETAAR